MEKVSILVLRRDVSDLPPEFVAAIREGFSQAGKVIEFVAINPRDYAEHDELCRLHKAAAVILPTDRPIPSLAMERGIPHLDFRGGQLVRLAKLDPQFEIFRPR